MSVVHAVAVGKQFSQANGKPIDVLRDISLEIKPGERVAIVGPSGSGKSTLLYCLCGFEQPTTGFVRLFGKDIRKHSDRHLARLYRERIGFVFQQYNLVAGITAYENVVLPLRLSRKGIRTMEVEAIFNKLGLGALREMYPSRLSGGEQQRTAVARALAVRPDILFADEPTGALDSKNGTDVMEAMEALSATGTAFVYVTHDASLAARAQRVVVMRDGCIVAELHAPTPEQIMGALSIPELSS